ncbi:MAG: hypothetical protein M0Z95_12580 [Actinomycetota bacterium]|jgi:glutamate formiminotransferase|nr:hypothetical protein [Actinomycetota bacterium]
MKLLEAAVNISEGRDDRFLADIEAACGETFLDLHADPDHHRSVVTVAGPQDAVEAAVRRIAVEAISQLDIRRHSGVHPRFGVIDIVPFVPLTFQDHQRTPVEEPSREGAPVEHSLTHLDATPSLDGACTVRDRFARWASTTLTLPCFLFGPLGHGEDRILPEVRRNAFRVLQPDTGPRSPHPTAGACAVGARNFLIAYNVWVRPMDLTRARSIASAVRGPAVRALAFKFGPESDAVQISCNLIDPFAVGPADVRDRIARIAATMGSAVSSCELVGLIPAGVLASISTTRWEELGLEPASTIEARLEQRGIAMD